MTRTTRTASVKENENANARPSRISTRTKPLATTIATSVTSGVTRATAASRAKASTASDTKSDIPAGKRKREALGEVTVPNGVVVKAKGATTRAPLRTVASTRYATGVAVRKASHKELAREQELNIVQDENAMSVDPPPQAVLPSITVRRLSVAKESHVVARRFDAGYHATSRSELAPKHQPDDDFEGDQPAYKKRRTSSVPPEEDPLITEQVRAQAEEEVALARISAEMEAFAEMPEADPENSPWDDLDADDTDDPLMVSEYVQDIFQYLKQVEVRYFVQPHALQY